MKAVDKDVLVYIPAGSDKGDCPYCREGVLVRDADVEKTFKIEEGYRCDRCGRPFIEMLSTLFRHLFYKRQSKSPRGRMFVEAYRQVY